LKVDVREPAGLDERLRVDAARGVGRGDRSGSHGFQQLRQFV
jgi:hypothetical protein